MRMLGNKKILSVYGDFRPVERRINNQKVSGWDLSEKSGESVEFENTYNDHIGGSIDGKSELKADWQGASGLSSQVQTVQGKNICPTDFSEWESGYYDMYTGEKGIYDARIRLIDLLPVLPSTKYYLNTFDTNETWNPQFVIRTYNSLKQFARSIGAVNNSTAITMASDEYFISVSIFSDRDQTNFTVMQGMFADGTLKPFICLDSETDKTYAPFIPNSPSPDYPSPVSPVHGNNLFDISLVVSNSNLINNNDGTLTSTAYPAVTNHTLRVLCPKLKVGDVATMSRATDASTQNIYLIGANIYWTTGTSKTITQEILDSRLGFYSKPGGYAAIIYNIQIELGSTATAYEPYYSLTAGATYKLPCPWGGYWEVTLPIDMHGIGDYKDQLEVDLWVGKGRVKQNINKYPFSGSETFSLQTSTDYSFLKSNISDMNAPYLTRNVFCTHFKIVTTGGTGFIGTLWVGTSFLNFNYDNQFGGIENFKSILTAQYDAGTPITIYYVRSTPLITNLTLTHVDSSTAPSLPLSSLNVTTQTPDYPSTIVSAGGEIRSRGKNLIPYPYISASNTTYGITWTVNNDRSITVSGTSTNFSSFILKWNYTLSAGVYISHATPVGVSIVGYDGTTWTTFGVNDGGTRAVTLTSAKKFTQIYCQVNPGNAVNGTFYPQLELGSTTTPYVPYRQPSSILLPTSGSAGDEEDTLEYVGEGVWKFTQRTLEYVFDGTEGWVLHGTTSYNTRFRPARYTTLNATAAGNVSTPIWCTHFSAAKPWEDMNRDCTYKAWYHTNDDGYIYFDMPLGTTLADMTGMITTQYTAGTPIIARYQLATPIVTYLNLGELKSFPRYTHIEQLGDVKATLNFNAKVYT